MLEANVNTISGSTNLIEGFGKTNLILLEEQNFHNFHKTSEV